MDTSKLAYIFFSFNACNAWNILDHINNIISIGLAFRFNGWLKYTCALASTQWMFFFCFTNYPSKLISIPSICTFGHTINISYHFISQRSLRLAEMRHYFRTDATYLSAKLTVYFLSMFYEEKRLNLECNMIFITIILKLNVMFGLLLFPKINVKSYRIQKKRTSNRLEWIYTYRMYVKRKVKLEYLLCGWRLI